MSNVKGHKYSKQHNNIITYILYVHVTATCTCIRAVTFSGKVKKINFSRQRILQWRIQEFIKGVQNLMRAQLAKISYEIHFLRDTPTFDKPHLLHALHHQR